MPSVVALEATSAKDRPVHIDDSRDGVQLAIASLLNGLTRRRSALQAAFSVAAAREASSQGQSEGNWAGGRAIRLGFESPSVFLSMFSRAVGTTPGRYFHSKLEDSGRFEVRSLATMTISSSESAARSPGISR